MVPRKRTHWIQGRPFVVPLHACQLAGTSRIEARQWKWADGSAGNFPDYQAYQLPDTLGCRQHVNEMEPPILMKPVLWHCLEGT